MHKHDGAEPTLMSRLLDAEEYYRSCFWSKRKRRLGDLISEAIVRIDQLEQEAAFHRFQTHQLLLSNDTAGKPPVIVDELPMQTGMGNVIQLYIKRRM